MLAALRLQVQLRRSSSLAVPVATVPAPAAVPAGPACVRQKNPSARLASALQEAKPDLPERAKLKGSSEARRGRSPRQSGIGYGARAGAGASQRCLLSSSSSPTPCSPPQPPLPHSSHQKLSSYHPGMARSRPPPSRGKCAGFHQGQKTRSAKGVSILPNLSKETFVAGTDTRCTVPSTWRHSRRSSHRPPRDPREPLWRKKIEFRLHLP